MRNRVVLSLILPLAMAFACKQKSKTSLKTLENIASLNPVYDACEGSYEVHPTASKQLKGMDHLLKAMGSVPLKIQKGFFEDLKGRIDLVNVISSSDCPAASRGREDDLMGCWQRNPDQKQSIKIILKRNTSAPTKEQYALVRVFGFIYGDILTKRNFSVNGPAQYDDGDARLKIYRNGLASTFLGELSQITPDKDRTAVKSVLSHLGIDSSAFDAEDPSVRLRILSSGSQEALGNFSSRVFAEAFHSRFCTAKTFSNSCKNFSNTLESFKPYAEDLLDRSEKGCLASVPIRSSSTHVEYFGLNQNTLDARRKGGADTGAAANASIAKEYLVQQGKSPSMGLGGFSLVSLFSGGALLDATQGGLLGVLTQLFGGGGMMPNVPSTPITTYPTVNPNFPNDTNNGNNRLPSSVPSSTPQNTGDATAEEAASFNATNTYRRSQGLTDLKFDRQLLMECREQAQLQAERANKRLEPLAHNLNGRGTSMAENIAYGTTTGEATTQMWINSSGHRANIIGNYTYMAVGNASNQWCQRFR